MENNEQIKNIVYKTIRKPVVVVNDLEIINEPSPELLADTLRKLKVEGKVLIIADEETQKNSNLSKAVEKSENVKKVLITEMVSEDVKEADYLVVTKAAMKDVSERLSKL